MSLVAEGDGQMVGRLACRPVSTLSGATGVGLAPVSVTVSHRRQGVAAMLIRDGLSRYRTAGYGSAVVLGEPNYYRRFGFRPAANSAGTKLAGASRERRLTEELVLETQRPLVPCPSRACLPASASCRLPTLPMASDVTAGLSG